MALNLSVPNASAPLPKGIETNPKKARAWIESLPLTKTTESGQAILGCLTAINRAKLPAEERVALVETYRPVINVLLDELDAIYAYASLPLQAKPLEAFSLAHTLSLESSFAYKLLILEKSSKLIGFGNKKSLPTLVHRAMSHAMAVMLQSYKAYYPIPAGIWQEVNSLYLYADELGFATDIADEACKSSVADLYFEMLMLSLADPYRLMHREVERVCEVLRQGGGLVGLKNSAEGVDPQRAFVVALDADCAPRPMVQGNRPAAGNIMRLIDSSRLVERIQQKLKAGIAGGAVNAAKSRATHDLNDLMGRLVRLWGDPPKRQFRRNPSETGVVVCAGVKAIAHFAELAANENPQADLDAIREGRTIPLLKIPQDPISQSIGVEEWQVLNQSPNGLRMHRATGGNVAVTVGEAIGVRFAAGRGWNLGIVRWLSLQEGSALEFGMELISPTGYSVLLEATAGASTKVIPALLLSASHPEVPSDTVLTLPDTFADLRAFALDDHGEISNVRATTLIEHTAKFDLFQFQPS